MATPAISPARGRSTGRPRGSMSAIERSRRRLYWPMLLPALLLMLLFYVAPILYAGWLSLHSWDGINELQWRGADNYVQLAKDPIFIGSIANTLKILFVVGIVTFVFAFALTMILRDMAGRKFVRSVLFFPTLINAMVFGIFAGFLFSPAGPINKILAFVGVQDPPKWLAQDNLFNLIMIVMIWSATGYFTTIIMSAVDQIPAYYYEAAGLDGAGPWAKFRHVTLPLAWDVISVCAVLWTMSSVKVFELILVFGGSTAQAPPTNTWATAVYVYQAAFGGGSREFGVSAAAAIVSLALVTVLTIGLRRMLRRDAIEI